MKADFSTVVAALLALFMLIGIFDRLRGNRWHLGGKIDEAFAAFPQLFVIMGGILALTPLLQTLLASSLQKFCAWCGCAPELFPGMVLANDMGAYHLALSFNGDGKMAELGGMLTGSVIGVNLISNIPMAVSMTAESDHPEVIRGILWGLAGAVPGVFAGGLCAGNSWIELLLNLIPVTLFVVVVALLILTCPAKTVKFFLFFGKAVGAVALIALGTLIALELTGIGGGKLRLMPLSEVFAIIGMIVAALPGAYVAAELFARVMQKALQKCADKSGLNTPALSGMIISLANILPVFAMTGKMNRKGKCVAYAFAAGGAFALGDHLAFCTVTAPQAVMPMLVTKITAAVTGAVLAWFFAGVPAGDNDGKE